jgi:uncharacterized membrane protein YeaQ/YmgE (transglycosylase-associated protein family)
MSWTLSLNASALRLDRCTSLAPSILASPFFIDAIKLKTITNSRVEGVAGMRIAPRIQSSLVPHKDETKGGLFMSVIGWIIFGLIAGIVAKLLTPGRDPGGFIVTTLIGIVGALIGGYIGRGLGWYQEGEPVGFLMAVVGSIVLLLLYRVVARRV